MASYTRTAAGHWRVSVKYGGRRETGTFDTKRQAEGFAAEALVRLRSQKQEEDGAPRSITLDGLFERYLSEVTPSKRGAQWESVRIAKFRRELPFIHWELSRIKHWHVQAWVDSQSAALAPGSVIRELNILSSVFTWAMRWRYLPESPTRLVVKPKPDAPRERRISSDEEAAFLAACGFTGEVISPRHEVAVAFLLALETAMRAGELLSLEPRTWDTGRRVALLEMTKNGRRREVPLSPRACELLLALPEGRFTISSASLSSLFRKYAALAGIQNLTFHDTRHEAITRLSKVFSVLELARVVGHTNPKQLMTYYNESAEDLAKRFT